MRVNFFFLRFLVRVVYGILNWKGKKVVKLKIGSVSESYRGFGGSVHIFYIKEKSCLQLKWPARHYLTVVNSKNNYL